MFFKKSAVALAFVALTNIVSAGQTPACLLSVIGNTPNPAKLSDICGSDAHKIQSAIEKECGDKSDAALKFFANTCKDAGHKVESSSTTSSTSGTSASASGSSTSFVTSASAGESSPTSGSSSGGSNTSGGSGSASGSAPSGAASPSSSSGAAVSDRQFSATTFAAVVFIGAAAVL
ncbi:Period circadian protein [Penicillium alfredii]|uniref:Period circadian protein n=1 Tax=Penicillium alfredii TaxID=1506179 RepID=A0A9W9EGX2_9EURO|nr:Period circadian protein [Penicillium alfredii]KAJ5081515.1 Period circadian protein [Penicillium alfredii]